MLQKGWLMISLLALTACAPDGGDTAPESGNELTGTTWVYTEGDRYEAGCASSQDGSITTYSFIAGELTMNFKSCRPADPSGTNENVITMIYDYTIGGTYLSTTGAELTELDLKFVSGEYSQNGQPSDGDFPQVGSKTYTGYFLNGNQIEVATSSDGRDGKTSETRYNVLSGEDIAIKQ